MPYATQQDIIDQYDENELIIASDKDNLGVPDPVIVEQALIAASNEIDTYVGSRYTLPLVPVPPVLKPLCIDIALYKMSTSTGVTEEKRTRYEDAVKLLTKIANGTIVFGKEVPPVNQSAACFSGPVRQFSRDTLKGF